VLSPILTGTDGVNKMGKSLNNYIAVFDTPNDKYGKVMSIPDSLIINYFTYAAFALEEEIKEVEAELKQGTNPMLLKKRLAHRIVSFYHSDAEADEAADAFDRQFSQREVPDEMPEYILASGEYRLTNILVDSGLCNSQGEAKRLIQGGGVSVDGERIEAWDHVLNFEAEAIIRAGKRRYLKLVKA